MEDSKKIKQMQQEGKITSDQAGMLLNALKESNAKEKRIFAQVIYKKKDREKRMWRLLGVWVIFLFICVSAFTFLSPGGDRKDHKQTQEEISPQKEIQNFQMTQEVKQNLARRERMNNLSILFGFIFLIFVLGGICIIFLLIYNILVRKEEKVNQAWAQINSFYQRKLDLIPALLSAAKTYLHHEGATLEKVTQARGNALKVTEAFDLDKSNSQELQKLAASQQAVNGSLGKLLALSEKYPDLKANENFLMIQKQMEESENLIVKERTRYNNRVKAFNTSLRYFPSNIIAELLHFQKRDYFEPERKAV